LVGAQVNNQATSPAEGARGAKTKKVMETGGRWVLNFLYADGEGFYDVPWGITERNVQDGVNWIFRGWWGSTLVTRKQKALGRRKSPKLGSWPSGDDFPLLRYLRRG